MNQTYVNRTVQWIVMVFLFFCGPLGWVLIYLLWTKWNPSASKAKAAPKKKSAKKA